MALICPKCDAILLDRTYGTHVERCGVLKKREVKHAVAQVLDDHAWLSLVECTPENLTTIYRHYYKCENAYGSGQAICRLVCTIASLKCYRVHGRGREIEFK